MNQLLFLGMVFFLFNCRIPLSDRLTGTEAGKTAGDRVSIAAIQGEGHISPYLNRQVEGVKGVVTLVSRDGFWMESAESGRNGASKGIFVYSRDEPGVLTGDLVQVSGLVREQGEANELTLTELTNPHIEILASSSPLPPPPVPGSAGLEIPLTHICNDAPQGVSRSFYDPREDLIDYWENFEGMVLSFDLLTLAGGIKNGQIPLLAGSGPWEPQIPLPLLMMETAGQESLFESAKTGDRILGPVQAVLTYKWGEYTLLPLGDWHLQSEILQKYVTPIRSAHDRLIVASFNLENFSCRSSGLNEQEFTRKLAGLTEIMAESLGAPQIIAVQEVMDDDGSSDSGLTEAWNNFTALTDSLNHVTGKSYHFASADPPDKTDGGLPGANIRTGFLYDMDRVKLLEPPKRLCTEDFADSRKPLLARFSFRGQEVNLVNVHLSSRLGDTPVMGEYQPPVLHSEPERLEQASILKKAISPLLEGNLIILGDFNDYPQSPVLNSLLGPSLFTDTMNSWPKQKRYTYIYKGRPEQLDHILISPNLVSGGFEGEILPINSHLPSHGRASDHDPLLVSLTFSSQLPEPDQEGGLFFSDYGEGSSYNKYLELANLSGQNIREGEYALIYCANGAAPEEGLVFALPALAGNSLSGICHSRSNEVLISRGSILNSPSFNGNDQLLLIRDVNGNGSYEPEIDEVVDIIGFPLSDEDFAKDRGMRRQPFVQSGSQTYRPQEWIPYSKERVDSGEFYGSHRTNRGVMSF